MEDTTQPLGNGTNNPQTGPGAAQIDPTLVQTAATQATTETQVGQPAPNPITPHTAAAAHGVVARIESELEKELAHGVTHFKTWLKTSLTELKQHLKV